MKKFLMAGAALSLSACLSYLLSMRWLKIKEEIAVFEELPAHLKGLRILHISDLHSNSPKKLNLDIWKEIDRLDFDMAVITGDVIVNYLQELKPHLPHIKRLAKQAPVFFVDGNHEMFVYEEVAEQMKAAGVTVLSDSRVLCQVEGFGEVSVIGLRDYYLWQSVRFRGGKDIFRAYSGSFNIVLTHQPQIFRLIKKFDIGLVIAGHTHGGQVRLPFLPTLYAPGQGLLPRYGDGWYEDGKNKMYISRGIGTTVFPIRLFNRPEIAVIELG